MEVISILGENSIMKTSTKQPAAEDLLIIIIISTTNYKSFNLFQEGLFKHDKFLERGYFIYGKDIRRYVVIEINSMRHINWIVKALSN